MKFNSFLTFKTSLMTDPHPRASLGKAKRKKIDIQITPKSLKWCNESIYVVAFLDTHYIYLRQMY